MPERHLANVDSTSGSRRRAAREVASGEVPDIALVPQPGVVKDLAKRGKIIALDGAPNMTALKTTMVPGTLEAGTFEGRLYGLLLGINVKSAVFYPKKAWEAAGYKAPATPAVLDALAAEIKADGTPPWCFGLGAEAATGHNQWANNEIKIDSPLGRQAAAQFEKMMFTEGNVPGRGWR